MPEGGAGFLGAPIVEDARQIAADVAIVGIGFGVPYPGRETSAVCADAPAAIRARSQRLARFRGHHDFEIGGPMLPLDRPPRIVDAGDVPGDPADARANAADAEAAVRAIVGAGAVPIVLGGDDSVPIPVLRALDRSAPLTVLQLDAHLDFRNEVAGVRDGYSSPMRRASEMAHVAHIVQVGLRGVGSARPGDVDDAVAAGNLIVTAQQLRAEGVAWLIDQLPPDASAFLSLDLDALDPSVCPAVSAPAPGGLSYVEASDLVSRLAQRCRVVGAAVTELAPSVDRDGMTALVATRLVVRLLASMRF